MTTETKADAVMRLAFPPCWPVSAAFKSGCRAKLSAMLDGAASPAMPYLYGSHEAAQYLDGQQHGETLAGELLGFCCDHAHSHS